MGQGETYNRDQDRELPLSRSRFLFKEVLYVRIREK